MKSATLVYLLFGCIICAHGNSLGRVKRGDDSDSHNNVFYDLLTQLSGAIQKITKVLSDPGTSGQNTNNLPPPKLPTPQDLGFCTTNPNNCQYLACLAANFQHSQQAKNIKQGSIVLSDPNLRQAVANDPTVSKQACSQANLTAAGCQNFKTLLGIVNVLDPASAHVNDEPRDKRSPHDDYANEHPGPKSGQTPSPVYKPQDCEAIHREVLAASNKPTNNVNGGLPNLG